VVGGPPPTRQAVIFTALAANVAIAVAKAGASAITGSSAMLAEAIHSVADSVNEVLLRHGRGRRIGRRRQAARHRLGSGSLIQRASATFCVASSHRPTWIGGFPSV
jgi:divalent metal cation (Fe/Co/Zn/Cd) transporter